MQVHRESTAAQVESHLRRHVYPQLGDRRIGAIRPSEVQAWVRGRSEVLAPATVEVVDRYLSSIFKEAVTDRLIPASPCVGVKLPKIEKSKVVPLEAEHVRALADAMPERYRAVVTFAAGTGLRQGECFGVTLDRVDFLRRHVTVDRQLVLVRGAPKLAPPRSQASYRTVPLPDVVLSALAEHLREHPVTPDGFIFTTGAHKPIRRNRFSEIWHAAARRASLPEWATFHDLRHFYASLLIRHGESVKVVQARLGHASAVETLDTYGHLWPDSEDRTRAAADAVLGAPPAGRDELRSAT